MFDQVVIGASETGGIVGIRMAGIPVGATATDDHTAQPSTAPESSLRKASLLSLSLCTLALMQAAAHAGALVGRELHVGPGGHGWYLLAVPPFVVLLGACVWLVFAVRSLHLDHNVVRTSARLLCSGSSLAHLGALALFCGAVWFRVYGGTLQRLPPTVDFAHHALVTDAIRRDGALPLASTGNLGGLWSYPPGFHVSAALVSKLFGLDVLRAMNLVAFVMTVATVAATQVLAVRLVEVAVSASSRASARVIASVIPGMLYFLAWPYGLGSIALSYFAAQHYSVFHIAAMTIVLLGPDGRGPRTRRAMTLAAVLGASATFAFPRHALVVAAVLASGAVGPGFSVVRRLRGRQRVLVLVGGGVLAAVFAAMVVRFVAPRLGAVRSVAGTGGGITAPTLESVGGWGGALLLLDGTVWAVVSVARRWRRRGVTSRAATAQSDGERSDTSDFHASHASMPLLVGMAASAGIGLLLLVLRRFSPAIASSVSLYTATKQFPAALPFVCALAAAGAASLPSRIGAPFRVGRWTRPGRWLATSLVVTLSSCVAIAAPTPYVVTLERLDDDLQAVTRLALATSPPGAEVVLAVRGLRAYTLSLLFLRGPISDPSVRVETEGPIPLPWDQPAKKLRYVVTDSLSLSERLDVRPGWDIVARRGAATLLKETP